MTVADRVGVMERGRLVQIGSPREIYGIPRISTLRRAWAVLPSTSCPASLCPISRRPPLAATVGARTEHVRISKTRGNDCLGTVTWVEHLGDQDHLHIQLVDRDFVTLSDPESGLAPGDLVAIDFVNPLFFDSEGARVRT
jgi:multiple sugar transport system ATP-binding protein